MTNLNLSFPRYRDLLRLRRLGCPVEYPKNSQIGQRLRLEVGPSFLETNLYPISESTAVVFWLDVCATAALTVHKLLFTSPWAKGPLSLLAPSQEHRGYYCLPPGIWIRASEVLNHKLTNWRELQRNQRWEGFLLGTLPDSLSASAGAQLEALFSIEDLRGYHHTLPIILTNHPLCPDWSHKYGEAATFPPELENVPTSTAESTVTPTLMDKTETFGWKIITEMFPEMDKDPEVDASADHSAKGNGPVLVSPTRSRQAGAMGRH